MTHIIIAVVLTVVIVGPLTWKIATAYRKKSYEDKIGSAEAKSREIIEEAIKTAETKKREALLEAKEESLKTKNELEREVRERRSELQRYEKRVLTKEESLDKKLESLEKKEEAFLQKEEKLFERSKELESLYDKGLAELERISGLSTEEAKELYCKRLRMISNMIRQNLLRILRTKPKKRQRRRRENILLPLYKDVPPSR